MIFFAEYFNIKAHKIKQKLLLMLTVEILGESGESWFLLLQTTH